jgi:excisionase family DNA binding protein
MLTPEKAMEIRSKKRRGRPPRQHREPADEIMTIPEVAEYLQCHASAIYRLLKQHQIPGFRLGGIWRFQRSVIDQWIRDRQRKALMAAHRTSLI